ncbi:MAG: trehalose-6-phosphate synthase [Acidimicrobiales bacterium]
MVVANRLPVQQVVGPDGGVQWRASPGGLVSAVEPVMAGEGGVWIGWTGASGEPPAHFAPPSDDDTLARSALQAVALSEQEKQLYYDGFCNGTIWPLYHDAIERPEFHREWWQTYVAVNRRFAGRAADAAGPGATVWVHDYQLQLVPRFLRELRPDVRIGFFLHIPFPPQELFMRLPWRREVIEGLLGADLVGFQVPVGAQNFIQLANRLAGAVGEGEELHWRDRTVRVGAFPVSIDRERFERLADRPEVRQRTLSLRRRLGSPRTVLLGVDRLDYTKGIDIRLRAFSELLSERSLHASDSVLVQVAVPSREEVGGYAQVRERVERMVGEINGNYGQVGLPAVHYLHRDLPQRELVALYRAADVMLVTPFRDGLNLVAKEYVATRLDDTGVLVLSEFAGAARELSQALLVNPYDLDGMKEAIRRSVTMPADEAARRMQALRRQVAEHDVHAWARSFLAALEG